MGRRILVVQGHPDPSGNHFDHALAAACVEGAEAGGHEVRCIDVGAIDFPLIRSREDWQSEDIPEAIASAQADLLWRDHLFLVYPLWLGTMPALLKGSSSRSCAPGTPSATRPAGCSTRCADARRAW